MNTFHICHSLVKRFTLAAACLLASSGPFKLMAATPAQSPLLNRPVKAVAPNVFFTMDDSGSMLLEYMPDDAYADPSVDPQVHPADTVYTNSRYACVLPTTDSAQNPAVAIEKAASNKSLVDVRKPSINKVYYNPDLRYLPWRRSDGSDFPSITDPSQAPLNPRTLSAYTTFASIPNSEARVNLRDVQTLSPSYSRKWCGGSTTNSRTFSPAIYFDSNSARVDISAAPAAAMFPPGATAKNASRKDCSGTKCTRDEELINFANWFTYYRNRNYLAIGAASRAFGGQTADIRLGYGRINYTTSVEGAPGTVMRGVRDFKPSAGTLRTAFFTWLYNVPASGGTPLRRALDDVGQYFTQKGDHGPWGTNPSSVVTTDSSSNQAACRKNYHMLMTDGYWSDETARTTAATLNVDGTDGPRIEGPNGLLRQYKPSIDKRFTDSNPNTLADVAMYYWVNDLRPDVNMPNVVPYAGAKSNPTVAELNSDLDYAFWQNLSTYTIGLGVTGSVSNTSVVPPAGGWPKPMANTNTAIDDLWHTAVNGRGAFVSAKSSDEFENAVNSFLSKAIPAPPTDAGVAVSSPTLVEGSLAFIPSFKPGLWSGDIEALPISTSGVITTIAKWSANAKLSLAAQRNLLTWDATAGSGVAFNTSMPAALKTATLWNTSTAPADTLIDFIRGDRSLEGSTYRCRGRVEDSEPCSETINKNLGRLGDFVDSTPVLVKGTLDQVYQFLPSTVAGYNSYRAFVSAKKARTTGVLFAGANDGMLHAFNENDGTEAMGFIPYAVIGNLARLADPDYGKEYLTDKGHKMFVNGPIREADAYLNDQWTNLVVGSTGGGGKSVFALKVDKDKPGQFGAGSLLWELNSSNVGTAYANDLGYVLQPLAVGPAANNQWVALFGNGPDSGKGSATLFVVDLASGKVLKTIVADTSTGNGLGGVTLIRDAKRVIIGAYAGDMKGNLWRFDMESTNPDSWKVGFGGAPLFKAGSSQPITAAPGFLAHPKGGVMVIAGTGQLIHDDDTTTTAINESDLITTAVQSVYGIWDKTVIGSPSNAAEAVSSRSQLVEQTFTPIPTPTGKTGRYWSLSNNTIAWDGTNGKRGYFLQMTLQAAGEYAQRAVFPAQITRDLVFMNTIAPSGGTDLCGGSSATSYYLLFSPLTGGAPVIPTVEATGLTGKVAAFSGDYKGPGELIYSPDDKTLKILGGRDSTKPLGAYPSLIQRNWSHLYNHP